MENDLDNLIGALSARPVERSLDDLERRVQSRLSDIAVRNAQSWRLRGAAAAAIVAVSIFISANGPGAPAPASASAVWSPLAPSTLLEGK